jgi:hypothetical protein
MKSKGVETERGAWLWPPTELTCHVDVLHIKIFIFIGFLHFFILLLLLQCTFCAAPTHRKGIMVHLLLLL